MKTFTTLLLSMFIAFPALAMDLTQARSQGVIGENRSGYVEALKSSPEVERLVSDINNKRLQEYGRISGENGQSVDVVAKLAAAQIIKGLPTGAYYQAEDGSWVRR